MVTVKRFDLQAEIKVLGYLVLSGIITTFLAWIAGLDLAGQPAWIIGIFYIVNLTLKGLKDRYIGKTS